MKKALVVGGSSGIGLAMASVLLERGYGHIYIADRKEPNKTDFPDGLSKLFEQCVSFHFIDLAHENYDIFDDIRDIDTLIITAGFGRVAAFEDLTATEIKNLIKCNQLGVIQIIKKYYYLIQSTSDFNTLVMGSIAGHIVSPLFSVYGSSKSGLCQFIENINCELAATGYANRILDVSPGSLKHTAFNGGSNNIQALSDLAASFLDQMYAKNNLYIPDYENIYKGVIERYHEDPIQFGVESYQYKINGDRVSHSPQTVIGYLSGTFDLFHVGHLNLLRRAKQHCDYLIVGVHKDGSWKGKETFIPFEERRAILESIVYVDKVVQSFPEDSDAYDVFHYNKLFVGSDYLNSERFKRYEEIFREKNVEIVYFPYTQGTSSTQLRDKIKNHTQSK